MASLNSAPVDCCYGFIRRNISDASCIEAEMFSRGRKGKKAEAESAFHHNRRVVGFLRENVDAPRSAGCRSDAEECALGWCALLRPAVISGNFTVLRQGRNYGQQSQAADSA